MRPLRLFGLVIILLASMETVALAQSRVIVRDGLGYKPHEISISGDGDVWVQGLRWRSWGGKSAVAVGQAVEQERPSHVNYTYPTRVTVSHRAYCANLHRTVYKQVVAQILGPNPGVFGGRTVGVLWTCTGILRLTAWDSSATAPASATTTKACSTGGLRPARVTRSITTRGTSCASARRLVDEWFIELKRPNNACTVPDGSFKPAVCTVHRWRCRSVHTVNGQTYPVTCASEAGRRRVHFINGV